MTSTAIDPEMMIPELFRRHPQARQIFNRHGLTGCGGRFGPVESIGFFARAHGVNLEQLLGEIHQTIHNPELAQAPQFAHDLHAADSIYRRYFTAGILVLLTVGASWGLWLLWQIGFAQTFSKGASIYNINAHGHAQIYGWVGLFIMGFAYQAFPRIWHTSLVWPRMAVVNFGLMIAGILIRTFGMSAQPLGGMAIDSAMFGGALEMIAIVTFAAQIVLTYRHGDVPMLPYVGFIFAALFFFFAQTALDLWHTYMTMSAAPGNELVWYVSTYQAPLRDLQIHGLALFMILGVSLRILPALFDVAEIPHRRAWWALGVLLTAVVGETILFVAYRWTNNHVLAAFLLVPWLMLLIGCWMVAGPWKLWRPAPSKDRSVKFIRAAYGWLALSLVMLILLPVYQQLVKIPFSHAYFGAIRHAITVGFISLMIIGVASKVVPTLNGVDPRKLTPLWGPFILINIGCALRVSLQILTDWNPVFFALVGISALFEITALTWWGVHLIGLLRSGKRLEKQMDAAVATERPGTIDADMRVTDVLDWYPATMNAFDAHGFSALRNPLIRRTAARSVTIRQAAMMKEVDLQELLGALRYAAFDGKCCAADLACCEDQPGDKSACCPACSTPDGAGQAASD